MKIAIDVMNGDKSPSSNINGALKYLIRNPKDYIYLVGKKAILKKYNSTFKDKKIDNFKYIYAEETISDKDSMTRLFKKKPECSLIKCIELLQKNEVDAVVSSGNTAALLSSSLISRLLLSVIGFS